MALEQFKSESNIFYLAEYTGLSYDEVLGRMYDFLSSNRYYLKGDYWGVVRRLNYEYSEFLKEPKILREWQDYQTYDLLKNSPKQQTTDRLYVDPNKRLHRYEEIPIWQKSKIPLGEKEKPMKRGINE